MVLAGASHYPAEAVTAGRGFAGPGTLARGLPTRSGDTMNALAANDIEATYLLAGLGDDGPPGCYGPSWSTLAALYRT